ncbi:NAD(P)/FAD-dependent oxidoreductase [Duganella sp. HH105]|uniref:FAD-dependent oxidoreductase n=1 Tax=Duganella sp. HH105 TaxID=1781067 RepID=UPI000877B26D|nr:FAD-dependent monooxygenase [Duganella sp. HH105]OEZ63820.1 salicylate hydroxylase [Duganella sp. HH105]
MQNNTFHVAIIGGGLGGLCLAQGLKRQGIAFDVFERDSALDSRTQGFRIRINADGQAALRHCLPPQLFELFEATCADDLPNVHALDTQLNNANHWLPAWNDDDTAELKVHRQTLREVLMCGIADRVHFNKALREVRQLEDDVVAFDFTDGSSYRSNLLVGADGGGSRVAAQCFPEAQGSDTGAVCIYGKVPLDAAGKQQIAPVLYDGTTVIFAAGLAVVIDAMRFSQAAGLSEHGLTPANDYLYWAMIGMRERLGLAPGANLPATDAHIRECIADVGADWAPGLRALFDATPAGMSAMLPVRQAPPPQAWLQDRVTLLGDAAHVMSPASGLGCNTALLDADLLVRQLSMAATGAQTLDQSIARYEQGMRVHAGAALRSSERSAAQLYGGTSSAQ